MNLLMETASSQAKLVKDSVFDQRGLQSIKRLNGEQTPEAMREVAKKFEGMLLQQMLKTMRETNEVFAQDSYFNSNEEKFHRDMMDQQMVINLTSGRGIGIADHFYKHMMAKYENAMKKPVSTADGTLETSAKAMPLASRDAAMPLNSVSTAPESEIKSSTNLLASLERELEQLMKSSNNEQHRLAHTPEELLARQQDKAWMGDHFTKEAGFDGRSPFIDFSKTLAGSGIRRAEGASQQVYFGSTPSSFNAHAKTQEQRNFVEKIRPHAERAAKELNLDANVLVAQAALETGWGKHIIHTKQGENSFNLFNIKASNNWSGDRVSVSTLEYYQGVGRKENAQFRKYDSYEQSFSDYVSLIKNNGRYADAVAVSHDAEKYAEALQAAGYATDPNYAQKIKQLLKNEIINAAPKVAAFSKSVLSDAAGSISRFVE